MNGFLAINLAFVALSSAAYVRLHPVCAPPTAHDVADSSSETEDEEKNLPKFDAISVARFALRPDFGNRNAGPIFRNEFKPNRTPLAFEVAKTDCGRFHVIRTPNPESRWQIEVPGHPAFDMSIQRHAPPCRNALDA